MKILVPHAGLGKELSDLLREKLCIPDHVTKFSVNFATDKPITIDCTYFPVEKEKDAA